MANRTVSTSWVGVPVLVTSRFISRYAWTTATIEVAVNGRSILSTGGVMKITGSTTTTFEHNGTRHEAKLSWGRGSVFSFPVKLEIDGALVADSRVGLSNWWLAFWPFTVTIMIGLLIYLFSSA